MFAKRLLNKVPRHSQSSSLSSSDIDVKVVSHYGIPSTVSVLAFDSVQSLLAIGTRDGRIKVIGGDYIEGLLISPKKTPYKYLEFLHNQGFLIGVTNDNTIQVWDLKIRSIICSMQWESNITAFSVIEASQFMYVGDEHSLVSTLNFEADVLEIFRLPYKVSANALFEEAEIPAHNHQPVIAVLVQPGSAGNRVLIGYEHGVIILWDVSRRQVVAVRGIRNLHLKDEETGSQDEGKNENENLEEKEIGTLCWASSDGSVIAVGYTDGDILLWNMTNTAPSKTSKGRTSNRDVIKLQLSSAGKRLPVITLHWSPKSGSTKSRDGLLFVYGGDEIGAEEVLTVMRLEWVAGSETLRCTVRLDLALHGTFSDMILLGTNYARGKNQETHFCVLTNPGELHYYDDSVLFNIQERKSYVSSIVHPVLIPAVDPYITATRLSLVRGNLSQYLTESALAMKAGLQFTQPISLKWPVTGGIPSQLFTGCDAIERVFIAGYQDGSIRIYDATYSTLSLLCLLEPEVPGITVAGSDAPVTKVEICSQTSVIAVGNECGLVRIYNLTRISEDARFYMITESKSEDYQLRNIKGNIYRAAVCVRNSSISAMKFSNDATRLAIGYGCGSIAVLDVKNVLILFINDQAFGRCPVKSLMWNGFSQIITGASPSSKSISIPESMAESLFILSTDSNIGIVDGQSGKVLKSQALQLKMGLHAISVYTLEKTTSNAACVLTPKPYNSRLYYSEASSDKNLDQSTKHMAPKPESVQCGESLEDPLIILCCEDSIHVYSVKSVTQGKAKPIHKVKLRHTCCWTGIFNENSVRRGLVLLYQTGLFEIRSFPYLESVKEFSLMSLLSWNFQPQMDKMMSSSDWGEVAIVNRGEFALLSLLSGGNDFRIPESLPSLHDEVLAAALTTSTKNAAHKKKNQGTTPAILSVVKGLKGGKSHASAATSSASYPHLEQIFSQLPFSDLLPISDHQEVELDLDDIIIEEPISSISPREMKNHEKKKGKRSDRDKLLQGVTSETEPRVRTPEEILAAYRKTGDASSAAARARSKLVERQAKLERISKGAEDLQNGAENFASLANDLVKAMEERNNRKWWRI